MQTNKIPNETVERMLQRGRTRMVQAVLLESELVAAHRMYDHWKGFANCARMYDHWKGFANCAAAILSGAAAVMASHDEACVTQSAVQAGLSCLPDHCERLSFADMKSLMLAQGVDFTPDAVTHGNVDAVVQLQDGVRMAIMLDDKHAVAGIDVQDSGEVHGAVPLKTPILYMQQGSGKSLVAAQVAALLGCTSVVDEWNTDKPLTPGALHLTNEWIWIGGAV